MRVYSISLLLLLDKNIHRLFADLSCTEPYEYTHALHIVWVDREKVCRGRVRVSAQSRTRVTIERVTVFTDLDSTRLICSVFITNLFGRPGSEAVTRIHCTLLHRGKMLRISFG